MQPVTFGEWLKEKRKTLGATQAQLARQTHCSVVTIRKLESNDLAPSVALAREMARVLEIPVEEIEAFVNFARGKGAPLVLSRRSSKTPWRVEPNRYSLPAPTTNLIGRARELDVMRATLQKPATRLLTLVGPPGVGKTRMALALAHAVEREYADGVCFVALAPITEAPRVLNALADALGVRQTPDEALAVTTNKFLRGKHLLLLLDNFEQIMDAAPLVSDLLHAAPELKIVITSREPLKIYGEHEFPVLPLSVPDIQYTYAPDLLPLYSAVELFVERAHLANFNFALTNDNAMAVAKICAWLDGLPLAIEMAAARVKWEPPQELFPHLARRLEALTGGPRDLSARQQTLRGALDWSYDLLEETEQCVLRHLGVFRGGFTLDAANAVCASPVARVLETLVEKSLVKYERIGDAAPRYALLEMIREYALEKLTACGEAERACERHWAFFIALMQTMGTDMLHATPVENFAHLKREQSNVYGALEWASSTGRAEQALALAAALTPYWYDLGFSPDALDWMKKVLALNRHVNVRMVTARAKVRTLYVEFLRLRGELHEARPVMEEAIADWRRVGETGKPQLAFALLVKSRLTSALGESESALAAGKEALQLYTELQDPLGQASAWRRVGNWALNNGDYLSARECLDHAVALTKPTGDVFAYAVSLLERGDVARATRQYALAQRDYEASDQVNQRAHIGFVEMRLAQRFGVIAALQGEPARGKEWLAQAAQLSISNYVRVNLLSVFAGLALCAALQQRPDEAMRWLGVLDRTSDSFHTPLLAPDNLEREMTMARVREQANEELLDKWHAEGRALELDDALARLEQMTHDPNPQAGFFSE